MEWENNHFRISTDKTDLQLDVIHRYLKDSYWAKNIPKHIVEKSIEGSVCFGLYDATGSQIGFARLVTDEAAFTYLMDIFILEQYQRNGLGTWLMQCVIEYPGVAGLRRFLLATVKAHSLYAKFGFKPLAVPERIMEINIPDIYQR